MNLEQEIKLVLSYKESIDEWKDSFDDERRVRASNLNKVLYGENLSLTTGCGCVLDFMNVLKYWNKNKINQKLKVMKGQFKLKEGVQLQSHGCDVLTNDNCTDEAAIRCLKNKPVLINKFEVFPEDWKKLCKVKATPTVEGTAEGVEVSPATVVAEEAPVGRKNELLELDTDVLRIMADEISTSKGVKKAHHKAGEEKLVDYILENE